LLETSQAIDTTSRTLALQAVEMYMNAAMPVGTMVLGFESVSDLAVGWTYADGATGHSEDLLERSSSCVPRRTDNAPRSRSTGRRQRRSCWNSIERAVLEAELPRSRVCVPKRRRSSHRSEPLGEIRNDIAAAEQHKDGLEADLARIEAEIAAAQRDDGVAPGRLRMPVNGWISSYYGWRVHPIFGTRRMHTGIDLAAIGGTPIYAAEAGTVIIAGVRGGYGNAVVIDHGGGLATLYAHQSRYHRVGGRERGGGRADRFRRLYRLLHRRSPPLRGARERQAHRPSPVSPWLTRRSRRRQGRRHQPQGRHDYEILDTFEAGMVLRGSEVKSLRDGKATIKDSFAHVKDGEVFLVGLYIGPHGFSRDGGHAPERTTEAPAEPAGDRPHRREAGRARVDAGSACRSTSRTGRPSSNWGSGGVNEPSTSATR
jgi:murein DD-endopeptidase MepM/ murein hydrolase activator NlpD